MGVDGRLNGFGLAVLQDVEDVLMLMDQTAEDPVVHIVLQADADKLKQIPVTGIGFHRHKVSGGFGHQQVEQDVVVAESHKIPPAVGVVEGHQLLMQLLHFLTGDGIDRLVGHQQVQQPLEGKHIGGQVDIGFVDRKASGGVPDQVMILGHLFQSLLDGSAAEVEIGAQIAKMFCGDLFRLLDENNVAYDMVEPGTPEELTEATRDHEAVITFYPLNEEKVNALADSVKGIVVTSIGYDNIHVEAANKRGIMVCNIPDYCTEEVALHSVTLILACLRNLCLYDRSIREGKWSGRSMVCGRPRHRLSTMTIGFMGFGRIGQRVAKMMSGMDVKFIAYDPYLPEAVFESMGVQRAHTPDEVYAVSDVISIYMLLNDETYHMIGRESIAKMKDGVILVNTARGALFDLDAVTEGLASGKVGAAGIDVWENEPVSPDHPILKDDNAIVSSHCAYFSIEANVDLRTKSLMTAVNICKGEVPYNCVNKKALGLA